MRNLINKFEHKSYYKLRTKLYIFQKFKSRSVYKITENNGEKNSLNEYKTNFELSPSFKLLQNEVTVNENPSRSMKKMKTVK